MTESNATEVVKLSDFSVEAQRALLANINVDRGIRGEPPWDLDHLGEVFDDDPGPFERALRTFEEEIRRREDDPRVHGITIDPPWSTDLDDALWVESKGARTTVHVTIANVSSKVELGTSLDEAAKERIATRYYATSHSSMLPRGVEHSLSLLPGVKRRGVTVELVFEEADVKFVGPAPRYKLVETRIFASRLKSRARVAYEEVPGILKAEGHALHALVGRLMSVASDLLAARRARGALVLYDLKNGWVSTEEGQIKKLERAEDALGHIIVQELMVAANAAVARYAVFHGVPILFRNHQAVGHPDRDALVALLAEAAKTGEPATWLDDVRKTFGKAMHRAEYGASSRAHFGLNLDHYTHFTSPIRRYADLVTHRQILAHVRGQKLPHDIHDVQKVADHINSTLAIERDAAREGSKEKAAKEAQRVLDAGEVRRIDSLGSKDFERLTKVVARSGEECPEVFADALLERLRTRRVPVLDRLILLCDPTSHGVRWTTIRQAIVDDLATRPHEAVSMIASGKDIFPGLWTSPTLREAREGPSHAPTFKAAHVAPGSDVPIWVDGRTAKEAQQRSAVVFLALAAGVTPPSFSSEEDEVAMFNRVWNECRKHDRHEAPEPGCRLCMHAAHTALGETDPNCAFCGPKTSEKESAIVAEARALATQADAIKAGENPPKRPDAPVGGKDPIMALGEHAQRNKSAMPAYDFATAGPSHVPTTTCTCRYEGFVASGTSTKKQDAKREAARAMLALLAAGGIAT